MRNTLNSYEKWGKNGAKCGKTMRNATFENHFS